MPIKCVILLISSRTWNSWVNTQIQLLYFLLTTEKVMVEPCTAISVLARSCRLFDVYGITCFLEELYFSTLHYLLKVIFL